MEALSAPRMDTNSFDSRYTPEQHLMAMLTLGGDTLARLGCQLKNASLRNFFGMTKDGTFRCQRGCEGCTSIMEDVAHDDEGRVIQRALTLPEGCPILILGLEKDPVVTIDWL